MAYRLGIDLGTASVALACIELDKQQNPKSFIYDHTHIFQEPVEPAKGGGVGATKASTCGNARRTRTLIDRRSSRLRDLAKLCRVALNIEPHSIKPDSGEKLHKIRALATTEQVELENLLLVFFRMAKRRGYSGGFKVKKEKDKEGKIEPGITRLKQLMADNNCQWLGQYLYQRFVSGMTLKLKNDGLYADREMVEQEFEQIWEIQSAYYPALNKKYNSKAIKAVFHNAIFYQRPLKSVAPMVGQCPLEPNLPRAPLAQPAAQEFRIEKQIADLRWGMGKHAQKLSQDQKEVICQRLQDKHSVSFISIYSALKKAGCPKPEHKVLNSDRSSRPELKGNTTIAALKKLSFLDQWQKLDTGVQVSIINFLADMGSPEQVDIPDWHTKYRGKNGEPRVFGSDMVKFINEIVKSGKFNRLSKMGFDNGRSAYSIKALKKLTTEMQKGLDEHNATQVAYPAPATKPALLSKLARHEPTGNIVVDVSLRQLRYVVNKMIDTLGKPPTQIIVELSRDMGLGLKRRSEIEKNIDKNRRDRKRAMKELEDDNHTASSTNIFRIRLWNEQDTNCPYCNKKIGRSEAVDGNITNLEHIIPKSLTRVGRQQDHIILSHQRCNDEKGNQTPWQRWGQDPERWKIITERAKALEKKRHFTKAKLLLLEDWQPEVITKEVIGDFTERQYHETSWISKLAAQWLRTICPDVAVARGTMTAHLRRIWGLNTVIPEVRYGDGLPVLDTNQKPISEEEFIKYKPYLENHNNNHSGLIRTDRQIWKRIDHRHHVIDAMVIALSSRSLFQKMAKNYKKNSELSASGQRVKLTLSVEPPTKTLRKQALDIIHKCHLTHKPDRYVSGSIFKGTAYGVAWVENDNTPNADPKQMLTLSIKLSELAKEKSSPEKIIEILQTIVSPTTRKLVIDEFSKRVQSGQTPWQALQEGIKQPQYNNLIKRVKLYRYSADTAAPVEFQNRFTSKDKPLYKYLRHDGYAYLETKPLPENKINLNLVTVHEAMKNKHTRSDRNPNHYSYVSS